MNTFFNLNLMLQVFPYLLTTGLKNTLILAVTSTALGLVFGMILALAAISHRGFIRYPARVYIDVFRGLPAILTIFLVGAGLPIAGLEPFGSSSYPYGIAALGLIGAAYIAEIFRSGIQSIHPGQLEAARAMGMSYLTAMRLVVIPQGVRNVLPALTNQFIGAIKDSSLVYLLGFTISQREIYRIGQDAAQATGNLSPIVAAGLTYLLLTVPLTHVVNYWDHRLKTGRPRAGEDSSGEAAPAGTKVVAETEDLEKVVAETEDLKKVVALTDHLEKAGRPELALSYQPRRSLLPGTTSGAEMPVVLSMRGVHKSFGTHEVLRGIDLDVRSGDVVCIIGPSGSGKSTLLRVANRLEEASAGQVSIFGEEITNRKADVNRIRSQMGMVFQSFNLFPHMSALRNVSIGPRKVKKVPKNEAERIAREKLAEVGLADKVHARPSQLSGGQQQRVAMARALAMESKIIFFDEVTSALDPELVKGVLDIMTKLAEEGMTMVVVTHEMGFARRVANRVVFMDKGKIVESGPPEQVFEAPTTERLKTFLSQVL